MNSLEEYRKQAIAIPVIGTRMTQRRHNHRKCSFSALCVWQAFCPMQVKVTSRHSRRFLISPLDGVFVYPAALNAYQIGILTKLMFTGLVETMGRVTNLVDQPPGKRFAIDAGLVADGAKIGDSICINGCCLTVIAMDGNVLDFEAGEETLSRTNLGELVQGSPVNLERSLAVGDRLGGHYVSGHIDDQGKLLEKRDDPPWAHLRFSMPARLASQVAAKGSIAIDGVSLTVVDADSDSFTVALIPHTLEVTTLGKRKIGDQVNLETDVLAKYVQRALEFAEK